MRGGKRKNVVALTLWAGVSGGVSPPLLLILAMIINSSRFTYYYGIFVFEAFIGVGVGLVVAACVNFLFWSINRFFSQQTNLYRLILFASPISSFVITFLLYGAWVWSSISGIAHVD